MFEARPSYSDRKRMPRPRPNGMITPMMEFLSRARTPITPRSSAASTEPTRDPNTTSAPISSAKAAPAKESSEIPWTAKARSLFITNVPMSPPNRPSSAPAQREFWTRASSSP
ncbi:hypothetical protein D9M72_492080 [compost metagenome]